MLSKCFGFPIGNILGISYGKYIRDFLWEIKRTSKSYIRYTAQKRKFLSTIHFQIWLKILNIFRAIERTSKSYIRYTGQKLKFLSTIHFQIWLKILNIFRAIKRTSKNYIRYTGQKLKFLSTIHFQIWRISYGKYIRDFLWEIYQDFQWEIY